MKNKETLVGAHISAAGGLYKSVERALEIGCTTMQIFTKSNRSWFAPALTHEEIEAFKQVMKNSGLSKIMVHSSYLINLAASNTEVRNKSITSLAKELGRCQDLEIPYLVLHPGSHTGSGDELGINHIAKNLDTVFEKVPGKTMILLETMAGQGTNIGSFAHIKSIIEQTENKDRLGVCLDTCHVFAAGYNIGTPTGYEEMMDEFCKTIGIRRLKALHLNDSKMPWGSKRDRHASLGEGEIAQTAFKRIMQDERLVNVPKILETPDPAKYPDEIKLLKSFT
ncbi:deoxyribonuclease IV [Candidatus Babeliales bacterium]|nr:deoxyribonuclease IV [Candidatus Babeliales bacterium]